MTEKFQHRVDSFLTELKLILAEKFLKVEEFNSCFNQTEFNKHKQRKIQYQLNSTVTKVFLELIAGILKEEVDPKFQILNKLTPIPDFSWRPPGDPYIQLRPVRVELKKNKLKEITALIKFKRERVEALKGIINEFFTTVKSCSTRKKAILANIDSAKAISFRNKDSLQFLDLNHTFESRIDS